jgi:hypothetical protein
MPAVGQVKRTPETPPVDSVWKIQYTLNPATFTSRSLVSCKMSLDGRFVSHTR